MNVQERLNEIVKTKGSTMEAFDKVREELGLTQTFLCTCLSVSASTWSYWLKNRVTVPEKNRTQLLNIFQTVLHLQSGEICRVDREDERDKHFYNMFILITEVADPKVSMFDTKEEAAVKLVTKHAAAAKKVLAEIEESESE